MPAKTGKMLGKTEKLWKLRKGWPPCNCPDCQQDTWGIARGETKRFGRRQIRTAGKRVWRNEMQTPEFNS